MPRINCLRCPARNERTEQHPVSSDAATTTAAGVTTANASADQLQIFLGQVVIRRHRDDDVNIGQRFFVDTDVDGLRNHSPLNQAFRLTVAIHHRYTQPMSETTSNPIPIRGLRRDLLERARQKHPGLTQGALVNQALLLLLGESPDQPMPVTIIPARNPKKSVRSLRTVSLRGVSVERTILDAR